MPQCQGRGGFKFPIVKERRSKWMAAVKRMNPDGSKWIPSENSVVCESHFVPDDFKPLRSIGSGRRLRLLKDDVVPSIFSFRKKIDLNRKERLLKRTVRQAGTETERSENEDNHDDPLTRMDVGDVVEEVVITTMDDTEQKQEVEMVSVATETENLYVSACDNTQYRYRIENFKNCPEDVEYLTGFASYDHFFMLYCALGPSVDQLKYKSRALDASDELFLTLMKLRLAKDDHQLHIDFQISKTTVGKIFNTWVNFLFYELSEMNIWIPRDVVNEFFPKKFNNMFPSTRVILDATETPIDKPGNCNAQRMTFSSYKNRNTAKTMIGVSPRGLVTYLSATYAGSVSDRQIMERSSLLDSERFTKADSIMADRGIMVQDLFASMDVRVNTPTTMKGRNQLDTETVVKDRRIASKRIHIERIIGYAKTFKILQFPMNHEKFALAGQIVHVCFLLTNFRTSIVGKWA